MKLANSLFALVSSSIALATALDFSKSRWIWTNELQSSWGRVPQGERAFRRLIPTPQGVTPVLANVLITADDGYTLFVNGNEIGSGDTYRKAQSYCVPLFASYGTLVAVTGVNGHSYPNPAGVFVAIEITFSDGSTQTIVGDAAWKALNLPDIPADYNLISFDDAYWPNAVTEGTIGSGSPWAPNITLPEDTSCGRNHDSSYSHLQTSFPQQILLRFSRGLVEENNDYN